MWMIKEKYLMLFYSACGKPTPFINRQEQVSNAYWLISLMEGVNIASLFLLINSFVHVEGLSKTLFFAMFAIPFVFNYFFYIKLGSKKILQRVDELIGDGRLKNKSYVVKYVLLTILFLALSGALNNEDVQSALSIR
jgi:hypothetical protein